LYLSAIPGREHFTRLASTELEATNILARVSDQLSAAMYNQTLLHRDEAMAETWEYHRNVAWTQLSWLSKNGTQPSFPVCTKGNASDCLIISKIR